jgi:DNA replication regulator SLD3
MSFPSPSPILPTGSLSVKKRKRDDTTHPTDIDSRPFTIQSAGDDPFASTTHFTPICVLQRAHLPLAFLDVKGSGSRLFAAHVQILESFHENGVEGSILVAEQKEEARLYVVERAAKRVYVLCRLGEWITRDTLSRLSHTPKEPTRQVKRKLTDSASSSPWWAQAAVNVPEGLPQDSRPTSATLRLAVQPQASMPIPKLLPNGTELQSGQYVQHAAPESQGPDSQAADTGSQDPIEDLARQYLDALYLSRTSLAYFAKGPLSRARSTLTGGIDVSPQSGDLVEFLRNSILPVNVMDKKYKESLAALIKDLSLASSSKDDKSAKSRRKKKFKPKRDKSGLFTNEQDYLEGWWHGEEITGSMTSPESIDAALRRRMPNLRMRETYLQIIIILETLYLETACKPSSLAPESQDAETQNAESQAAPETTKRKGKKALDLRSLLETLLDRLCIWQDLEADTPAKSLTERDAKNSEPSNELRDFCVEIVVPFFMSRLPKEAALVNKKLGGPSPPSPEKRKSTSSRSRPGEPATRSRPEKQPRKPLSRVATETLNHAARPVPGLHRSATDSALIKREESQPALYSIPPAKPPVRASALSSYLSGHRQVDLAAKSAAATERLRKKKETEAQVQEAINNARKPNRPMATKEVAARADERFAQALNKSRSSKSQRPQPPGVHVAATPKRTKPAFTNQFIPPSTHSSNPSIVPSSSRRPNMAPRVDSTPAVPQTSHRETANTRRTSGIEETPSRDNGSKFAAISPSALHATPIKFQASLCESPTARRAPPSQAGAGIVAATPIKMPVGRKVNFGLAEMPNKPAMGLFMPDENAIMNQPSIPPPLVEATPVKGSSRGLLYGNDEDGDVRYDNFVGGKSIYDVWNDDDDYEPLA